MINAGGGGTAESNKINAGVGGETLRFGGGGGSQFGGGGTTDIG